MNILLIPFINSLKISKNLERIDILKLHHHFNTELTKQVYHAYDI